MISEQEKQLSWAVLSGDKKAFEQLYKAYIMRLMAYVRRFTASEEDAEDVVQHSFMKLWETVQKRTEKQQEVQETDSVQDMLFIITRNATLNYLRNHATQAEVVMNMSAVDFQEDLYAASVMTSPDKDTIYNELRTCLNELIAQMPERQREVFLMSRDQQMKNQAIADQLGISIKAVEKHITASLKYLRDHLPQEYLLMIALLAVPF